MKVRLFIGLITVALASALLLNGCARQQEQLQPVTIGPDVEGTYKLVSRDLPDGTVQTPPNIMGLITFTKEFRNFNVYWKDAQGKSFSISYVASYQLTPTEYSERSLYFMVNDQIGGKGISYDLSGPSGTSPVTMTDGRIEFKMPNYDEPTVVFEGTHLTATREGAFVDHWEKVQ